MSDNLFSKPELTVAYQVKDRKASVAWYSKIFGFELMYDVEEQGWCEMTSAVNGVSVGFSEVEDPKVEGGATLTWGTTNVDGAVAFLEANGVVMDGPVQELPGLVKLAFFKDPDGNHLMLAESLSSPQ